MENSSPLGGSCPGHSLLQDTHQNTLMCLFISFHISVSPAMAQEGSAESDLSCTNRSGEPRAGTHGLHGMRILS